MCSVLVPQRTAMARYVMRLFLEAQKLLTSKGEAISAEKGQVVRKQPLAESFLC
jgi:hypothetical protein